MALACMLMCLPSMSFHRTGYNELNLEQSRPNVIIILSDDQGYGDFSCHGNPALMTPALDKLHDESIRFSDFHVSPLCTPTRGQLLTGMDAMHNGAATVLTGRNILRRDIKTMPEIFAANGYATGIFGKWHLGDNYPDRPMDRGFQKCVWHKGWGLLSEMEYDNDYYETRYIDSLEIKKSGEYCTNLWFNKAMEWMEEQAGRRQPFFTYIALNAPHGPYYAQAQDYDYFKGLVTDSSAALFLGMVRNIDRNMARLEDWLVQKGLKQNTMVVFMNDNGGTGGVNVFNAGMRESKGSYYEGGHRAACFMRWPDGNLGTPRTIGEATQIQDLLPTFIDLFDWNIELDYPLDGISLAPALQSGKKMDDRMFVVQYGGHVRPEKYSACIVWGPWRLVGENELYHIEKDPGQNNPVNDRPEILLKMSSHYEKWWKTAKDGINRFVPVVIGSPHQNPVIINSSNWDKGGVNAQWKIALADGPPQGGITHIHVAEAGKYRIELSRWPFHMQRPLVKRGPEETIGGTKLRPGKSVPVATGCVSINGQTPATAEALSAGDLSVDIEIPLESGDQTIQAWFKDSSGNDLTGAYYVKFEKLIK